MVLHNHCTADDNAIQTIWQTFAERLADWAMKRLVNRTDRHGAYRSGRQIESFEKQGKHFNQSYTSKQPLTDAKLFQHFYSGEREHLIGVLSADLNNMTLWGAVDIDSHKGEDKETNFNYATHLLRKSNKQKIFPLLLDSDGKGGFHLWFLFKEKVDAALIRSYLLDLTSDWKEHGLLTKPEVFPKNDDVRTLPKQCGNWLRLPGKHHTHNHFTRVYYHGWLEGKDAIDVLLSFNERTVNDGNRLPGLPCTPPVCEVDDDGPALGARHGNGLSGLSGLGGLGWTTFTYASSQEKEEEQGIPEDLMGKVQKAVARALPKAVRLRDGMEWRLAQAVKAIKEDWTGKQLRLIFDMWYAKAKKWMRRNEDYCWVEFNRAFSHCRFFGSMSPQKLMQLSLDERVPPQARHHTDGVQALVRACSYLQQLARNKPFPLSCEWATEIMGCKSKRTGGKGLKLLEEEGILRLVEKGNRETGNASTWLYLPLVNDTQN